MLNKICREIKNYFTYDDDKHYGKYTIENGIITPFDFDTDYYAIFGSRRNDGVHKKTDILQDEVFTGSIWIMSIPTDFLELVSEITEWNETNASTLDSPYTSESFGGYSYTKQQGGYLAQFGTRLNGYRKIHI